LNTFVAVHSVCSQKRVERTEARRQEAKQAKQKKQDRRLFKQQAQRLFDIIDKHGHRPLRLHVWSDVVTSSSGPNLGSDDEGGKDADGKKKKGRHRSNSSAGETPKKAHPRSKETAPPMHLDDDDEAPLSCMSYFFHARCTGNSQKKSGGCMYEHCVEPLKTLASLVKDETARSDAMNAALASMREDALEMSPNAMELLNYKCIETTELPFGAEDASAASMSEDLVQKLNQNDTNLANLVYVVAGDKLIFDRHRDGVFMNERDMLLALGGHDDLGRRRISVGSESEAHGTLHKLPGSILEHTLLFLPDSAVAICSLVCKDWNNEIGKASPHLWQQLLGRKKWPFPLDRDQNLEAVRKMFIDHYTARRDVDAIRLALIALASRKIQLEHEMCYQDFSTRKQAPAQGNDCVSVQVWSANRVLVGYRADCSLRLFEAIPKSSKEKFCKELVYQRLDPYKNTKRRRCTLLDTVLDDESIGSLCKVSNDGKPQHLLIVVSREEFLLGENSALMDKGAQPEEMDLHVIDIGEAMINYVLTSDTADHRQLQLLDFLQDRGEIEEVEVLASEKIIACGSGRFMVEVSISIPSHDGMDGEDNENALRLIDRKLVLFSAALGAIVWVGESCYPMAGIPTREHPITLVGVRRTLAGDYRSTCNFLVASAVSPSLSVGSVDPVGTVITPSLLSDSLVVWNVALTEGWALVPVPHRLVLISVEYAIAADQLEKDMGGGIFERKSIVSFYPLYQQDCTLPYHSIELARIAVLRMVLLGEEHLCLACREYGDFVHVDAAGGVEQMTMVPQTVCMIVIHVPTRHEIYRTDAGFSTNDDFTAPIFASSHNNSTIGCALNWSGISITGDDVRHMKVSNAKPEQAKETRKKKKASKAVANAKGRKKDGFARGMSSRG
jgi:hypothetical protein